MPEPVQPLTFLAADDAAVCDPVTGVCAAPDDESEVGNDDGARGEGAASAR
ncbi:hypothetical protein [Isoptericola chiayiensis]|uniref:hypothetical protein n=1 Tax=Isoptericola chiayiensis TaxID=579446 RepID=UPI001554DAAD|nr:hypothetical protein [Isoptericola chiayiensis]NOW00201.1 hypothetical protein [Isoptericola chiayiensis]